MSRPTHILRHEHRVIEQALRALDGICLNLKAGDNVPSEPLYQFLDFARNFADLFHHNKEETYLFPALCPNVLPKDGEALRFLIEEHQIERRLIVELELAIGEYCGGDSGAADRIIAAAGLYRDHLTGHMHDEEAILFRLAEDMLDETIKSSLIHSFTREMTQSDGGAAAKYEQIADELEKNWAA